jgi:hypothetical protein
MVPAMTYKHLLLPCTVLFLVACAGASPAPDEQTDDTQEEIRICHTEKIAFTRSTGCVNDGSVEFCVPKGDAKLKARLLAISPDITFHPYGGRARCNTTTQELGQYPTRDGIECRGDRMTSDTWADMCAIASQRAITQIVPTFFE